MKNKKVTFLLGVLTLLVMSFGTTFAWFNASRSSDPDALAATSSSFNVRLEIIPKYVDHVLIPLNDESVEDAYLAECKNSLGNGLCLAYNINVNNAGSPQTVTGTVDVTSKNLMHLSYIVYDEDGSIYQDITHVPESGTFSLGPEFILDEVSSKHLIILFWISNVDRNQNEEDGGGTFDAAITITSISGAKLTGTLQGVTG